MKYILSLILACLLLFSCAFAEETDFCAVTYGDSGKAVSVFAECIGYDGKIIQDMLFDDSVLNCLLRFQEENGLEASGCFDLETLCYIFGIDYVSGDKDIVWIPMNGGKKYHAKPECSNMIEPRQVHIECVSALELDACKKCYKLQDIKTDPEG